MDDVAAAARLSTWRRSTVFALLGVVLGAAPASAAEWTTESSIQARTDIADNYRLTSQPHSTVHAYSLSPSLSVSRTTESTQLQIDSSATSYKVNGERGDDRTDLALSTVYSGRTLADSYTLATQFQRDSTLDSELATTGIVLSKRQRNFLNLASTGAHAFSERWVGQLQLSAQQARYPGGIASGLSNYRNYSVPLSLAYRPSERDRVTLTVQGSFFRVDSGISSTRTTEARLAWDRLISERTTAMLEAGIFHSRSQTRQSSLFCPDSLIFCVFGFVPFEIQTTDVASKTTGTLLNSSLRYKASEVTTFQLSAARNLAPSGSGSVVVVQSAGASLSRSLSPTVDASFDLSQSRSRYIGLADRRTVKYLSAGAALNWNASPKELISVGIRHVETRTNDVGPLIRGNTIFVAYRYAWQKYSF